MNNQPENQNTYFGSIKAHTFSDGNMILKQSFSAQDLANMQACLNESGYVNLIISRRQQVSEWGHTHSCRLDTWKPQQQPNQQAPQPQQVQYQQPMPQQAPPQGYQNQQNYNNNNQYQ